jgi:hypothetical protein
VELHAEARQRAVAHGHHESVLGPGRHGEFLGQALVPRAQRVVTPGFQGRGQAREQRAPVVLHGRRATVHGDRVDLQRAAAVLDQRLVSQAHAQHRRRRRKPPEQLERHARLARPPGPRPEHNRRRTERQESLDVERIVAQHLDLRPQTRHLLVQVPGERVVVVDQQDHGRLAVRAGMGRRA